MTDNIFTKRHRYIFILALSLFLAQVQSFASINGHLFKTKVGKLVVTSKKKQRPSTKVCLKPKHARKSKNSKLSLLDSKRAYSPVNFIGKLTTTSQGNGITLMTYHGPLNINVLDLDLNKVEIEPAITANSFGKLTTLPYIVKSHHALAACNANYFKTDGTPLGTLIINNHWVTGPIFNRIALGIDNNENLYMNNINFHATIYTSNPKIFTYWINNLNQPRRTGSRAIIYNSYWGQKLNLRAKGLNIVVDSLGKIISINHTSSIDIPHNGYVISDRNNSPLNNLKVGDSVLCLYDSSPNAWNSMKEAISGGPCLIKNGKLFVDLKQENFRKSWTSSSITARTAIGFDKNKHLFITTIEGHHSLWDLAKFMKSIGIENALNLDGGGSTSLMLGNKILTHQKNQRKIETALLILPKDKQNN